MSQQPALTAAQQAFCLDHSDELRLLAPAGSGKTLSLLHRCAALAKASERKNERFLVFTFTRAARDELRDRLRRDHTLSGAAPLTQVTTLNSWGFRLLRGHLNNPRLVVNRQDQYMALQNVLQPTWRNHPAIEELLVDKRRAMKATYDVFELLDTFKTLGFDHTRGSDVAALNAQADYLRGCGMHAHLRRIVDRLKDLDLVPFNDDADFGEIVAYAFGPFWRDATDALFAASFLTLEDQKYWARRVLQDAIDDSQYSAGPARVHHILVDEFQDINPLDLELLRTISAHNKAALTIVGDDDQAIYEWRGASPEFILKPDAYIGGEYRTHVLDVNYRSPRNIVAMSQRLITNNKRRVAKEVAAHSTSDAVVEIRDHETIAECIEATTRLVQELVARPDIDKVALVSRKRSQIIPYQIVFAGANLPFYAAEDLLINLSDAFDQLKGVLAIRGRQNDPSPFGPGPEQDILTLSDRVKRYPLSKADRASLSSYLFAQRFASMEEALNHLRKYRGTLKGKNDDGRIAEAYADAIEALMNSATVADSIVAISEHFEGLQGDYGKSLEDIYYSDPPFFYLAELATKYGNDYAAFYRDVESAMATLAHALPADDESPSDPTRDRQVHLMTALRAKGKEFDAVIVLDAMDGVWPSKLALEENDLEQERRLFYVATTRARKHLAYVCSGSVLGERLKKSPYLSEMGLL